MTDRELMQMALDALQYIYTETTADEDDLIHAAINALRARLAQPEQEPVAYGVLDEDGQIDWTCDYPFCNEPGWPDSVPLYTSPPQREWVGLPESAFAAMTLQQVSAMKYAELLLKEKNNG